LEAGYDEKQMLDFIFTVGEYVMVSMYLNSAGVQLDPGVPGFPEGAGN
jgi:4-carboxymuconolactone decarboxylase